MWLGVHTTSVEEALALGERLLKSFERPLEIAKNLAIGRTKRIRRKEF